MKKFLIFILIFFCQIFFNVFADTSKIISINFDNSSSIININKLSDFSNMEKDINFSVLENPKRIYFDLENAVLIGEKQHLVFEKSKIKDVKIAQFTTDPNVVRVVISVEEDFDVANVKIRENSNNIIIKLANSEILNSYYIPIYNQNLNDKYSSIVVSSQINQKIELPKLFDANQISEIEQVFKNSTLANSDGKTYDSQVSVDISSNLKLRTKYYLGGYFFKDEGILINGFGQLCISNIMYLDAPKRLVIDLDNTFVEKKIRNKEFLLFPNTPKKDFIKIGQFEFNKARIVINTDEPEKYLPIISTDLQSLLIVNTDKLNHAEVTNEIVNLDLASIKKNNDLSAELTLNFTGPIIPSFIKKRDKLCLYLFNVKSYNELNLIKILSNTIFKDFVVSLLPNVGIKGELKLNKNDCIEIMQSVDGKSLKIVLNIEKLKNEEKNIIAIKEKENNKIILDAGHGGSDYGAIREGINEKDITLEITQRVATILKSKGYKVFLTRDDDKYLSLQERVELSETEMPEVFLSIHVNSAVSTEPNGIETHYYHDYSKNFAEIVHKNLMKNIDANDRGLFKSKFYVINHVTVPAILVEIGFLSNDNERIELLTEKRKYKTAKAIAEGIIEYCKKQK